MSAETTGLKSRKTRGICPSCQGIVPAQIVGRGHEVIIEKNCPKHGASTAVVSHDRTFYDRIDRLVSVQRGLPMRFRSSTAPHINGVFIDLTSRCNLHCGCCLASTQSTSSKEPELQTTLIELKRLSTKPVIYLSGGEPTLRPDLFQWIETLSRRGYDIKLLTNGVKLAEPGYAERLRASGLKWVMIQFDSLNDETLRILRGRELAQVRQDAVANASDAGLHIVLPCVVHRGLNENELGELVSFAARTPAIKQLSFLPATRQGDWSLGEDQATLEPQEIMDLLSDQTGGAITRRDFTTQFELFSWLYRLTRRTQLAPRRCFFPLVATRHNGGFLPAQSLSVSRTKIWSKLRAALAVLGKLMIPFHFERSLFNEDALFYFTIETFRELNTLDVDDAGTCSRYYLENGELAPACLKNLLQRRARTSVLGDI